jgi:sigma-B regulation protein RsbU (phosphoserine phosphatase)
MRTRAGNLTVLSSEPLDRNQLQKLAGDLGEITLYEGLTLQDLPSSSNRGISITGGEAPKSSISLSKPGGTAVLDTSKATPTIIAGAVPPAAASLDPGVRFLTAVSVVNWENGATSNPAGFTVQTRVSKLYDRLFAAQGEFAPTVEIILLVAVVIFALIELVAIFIGTRLTRTVTGAVAQLYDGTRHINRGDFSHRIPVKSNDQVAALSNSFNSMTASLEKLIEEQKEKQKLENELVIAQEVQAQLFPRQISQLASLEVHGFCRPARTVSGDYYDFLTLDSERLLLAVGDVSGKGISAALLMATIHSAVRAYSVDSMRLRELVATGNRPDSHTLTHGAPSDSEVAPGALLALLNHQLYQSTPAEKYATLFLGIYDGARGRLTYSNGGHLPPIVMNQDGSVRRLECGGTVIGLFDQRHYDDDAAKLRPGEIFLAYSDGITEPENEFGEFGDERLIDLLRANRHLPLPRISDLVTAALDDWIGQNEQPDDITLVLARAR